MRFPIGIGGIHSKRADVQSKLQSHIGNLVREITNTAREVLVDHIGPRHGPPATVELDVTITRIKKL